MNQGLLLSGKVDRQSNTYLCNERPGTVREVPANDPNIDVWCTVRL
jgi:hypothetical protein